MAGRKITRLFRSLCGDAKIEDLWCPFFAVSSSLSRATACIHRTGPVWRSIRASTAIPAIFPPVLGDEGEVLLDGGVMNNMPLDVMREFVERGTVIGVNSSPAIDKLKPYRFGPSVSGWQLLWSRLNPFGTRLRAPSLFGSLLRATEINSVNLMRQKAFKALADVLIEPPVESFRILDFSAYATIIEVGYQAAREAIKAWRAGMESEGAVAKPAAFASCFLRQAGGRE